MQTATRVGLVVGCFSSLLAVAALDGSGGSGLGRPARSVFGEREELTPPSLEPRSVRSPIPSTGLRAEERAQRSSRLAALEAARASGELAPSGATAAWLSVATPIVPGDVSPRRWEAELDRLAHAAEPLDWLADPEPRPNPWPGVRRHATPRTVETLRAWRERARSPGLRLRLGLELGRALENTGRHDEACALRRALEREFPGARDSARARERCERLAVGRPAPRLELVDLDGNRVSDAVEPGEALLVACVHRPDDPVVAELWAAARRGDRAGLRVVLVALGGRGAEWRRATEDLVDRLTVVDGRAADAPVRAAWSLGSANSFVLLGAQRIVRARSGRAEPVLAVLRGESEDRW